MVPRGMWWTYVLTSMEYASLTKIVSVTLLHKSETNSFLFWWIWFEEKKVGKLS